MLPGTKETKRGSSDQEALPSLGKKYWGSFCVMCCMECVPTAVPGYVDISEVSRPHLL